MTHSDPPLLLSFTIFAWTLCVALGPLALHSEWEENNKQCPGNGGVGGQLGSLGSTLPQWQAATAADPTVAAARGDSATVWEDVKAVVLFAVNEGECTTEQLLSHCPTLHCWFRTSAHM